MRKTLLILLFFISVLTGYSQPRQSSFTWLRAEDITNTRYFIWQGDTIDFSAFVDSIYVNYADTVAMLATQYWIDSLGVMKSDSTILYVTPTQLDSILDATISHDAVTLNSTATTGGLTLNVQEISFQPATASQNGYLKSIDWVNFNSKIATVSHNETMTGLGTSASPLKVDTTLMATKYYVDTYGGGSGTVIGPASAENLNIAVFDGTSGDTIADGTYTIAEVLNLGNATGTLSEANIDSDIARDSEIPEISDIAYNATTWDGNTDGATKNALRDKFESLSGGHDPVTIGTANGLSLSTQELSLGLSSISATGALSSTDWNTFNNKQDALTTGNLTENITGLEFDSTRQVIGGAAQLSLSTGYLIPSTTDTTFWGQGGSFTETDPTVTTYTKSLTSASALLTEIKTVDGSTSGLDADLLDNISSNRFVYGDDETANIHYTGDLNSITKSGFYYANATSTNRPSGESDGYLITNQWANNANYQVQYFTPYDATKFYLRRKLYTGSWGSWSEISGSSSGITDVSGVGSVETAGSTSITVTLDGDLTTPGNSKYYGTDSSGSKGWYSLPSSGGGDMYKSTYDIDDDGDIDVAGGGTNIDWYSVGDILYASGNQTLSKLSAGTSGYVLTSNGAGVAPSWQAVSGSSSLWDNTTDLDGISYSAGNVSIGTTTITSTYLLRAHKSIDSGYAAWFNNGSSSGNGVLIQGGNGSTEYALRVDQEDGASGLFNVMGNGSIDLLKYGSGTFTGTAAKWLAVDSSGNLIEENVPSGISPGGSDGDIQYNNSGSFGGFGDWSGTKLSITGGLELTQGLVLTDTLYKIVANGGVQSRFLLLTDEVDPVSTSTDNGVLFISGSNDELMYLNTTDEYKVDMTSTSDFWKKKDFRLIDSPLQKILSLQSYQFNWNNDYPEKSPNKPIKVELKNDNKKRESTGMIAQEVEKIIPEVVGTFERTGYKNIDYDALIPYVIEAIKEQQKQINSQARQNAIQWIIITLLSFFMIILIKTK